MAVRDLKAFGDLVRAMRRSGDLVVVAGAPSTPSEAAGLTQGELLAVHEYGTRDGSIPARPVLRTALQRNADAIMAGAAKDARQVVEGAKDVRWLLGRTGLRMEREIKATFGTTDFEGAGRVPLDPATVARKGSSRPLIDTGSLRASITAKVMRASEVSE